MDRNQMNNIIGFVFNFHQQCDVDWVKQSPSYIKEKWDKYIGVSTISNFIHCRISIDDEYNKLEPLRNDKINNWLEIWKVSEEDFLELKEIVYLIYRLNTKAILFPKDKGKYRVWYLESLIEEFSKFIDIKKINKEFYNHQHDIVKRQIVRWLDMTENKRSYNLNLIL